MKVKRILLTGDDGYHSLGIRLLIHYLKNKYTVAVAATKSQQSGVGGHLSVYKKFGTWGKTKVDGVETFWVDGYPADAVEFAQAYFPEGFDLVISGLNLGVNIGGSVISSGTFSAGFRALAIGLAPKAIVTSWHTKPQYWNKNHSPKEDISPYLEYPGRTMARLIDLAIKKNLWGADILNVNFPAKTSKTIKFTVPLPDLSEYYSYPLTVDTKHHRYTYPRIYSRRMNKDWRYDSGAVLRGYISVTPCQATPIDAGAYRQLKDKTITL